MRLRGWESRSDRYARQQSALRYNCELSYCSIAKLSIRLIGKKLSESGLGGIAIPCHALRVLLDMTIPVDDEFRKGGFLTEPVLS